MVVAVVDVLALNVQYD
jgi:hypothetical protein